MRIDEARLVRRMQAGDADAFALFVAAHRPRLEALAARQLRDREEACDVVQDAIVRAFQSLGSLRSPAAFPRWLTAIVLKCCADRRRRTSRRRRLAQLMPSPGTTHWDAVTDRLAAEQSLNTLPHPQRAALRLYYLDGFSVAEVARQADRPVGTIKRWLHDGRLHLQREVAVMERKAASEVAVVGVDLSDSEYAIIQNAAEEIGLRPERYRDPWEGWAALNPAPCAQERPALVVLARSLAGPDETFTLIAMLGPTGPPSASHLRDIPVLVLGPAEDNIILAAWSGGAAAYLSRPPNAADLTEIMRRLVADGVPCEHRDGP